jgi:uncharacterized protein with PQ loop repeat
MDENIKTNIELLGHVAVLLVALTLFPQIYTIIKKKKADSISYLTYIIHILASGLLIIYAFYLNLLPILLGNSMILINSAIIIFLKYKYS